MTHAGENESKTNLIAIADLERKSGSAKERQKAVNWIPIIEIFPIINDLRVAFKQPVALMFRNGIKSRQTILCSVGGGYFFFVFAQMDQAYFCAPDLFLALSLRISLRE